jgi:hypothetical protein
LEGKSTGLLETRQGVLGLVAPVDEFLALEYADSAGIVDLEDAGSDLKKRKRGQTEAHLIADTAAPLQVSSVAGVGDVGISAVSGGATSGMSVFTNPVFDETDVTVGPESQARRGK